MFSSLRKSCHCQQWLSELSPISALLLSDSDSIFNHVENSTPNFPFFLHCSLYPFFLSVQWQKLRFMLWEYSRSFMLYQTTIQQEFSPVSYSLFKQITGSQSTQVRNYQTSLHPCKALLLLCKLNETNGTKHITLKQLPLQAQPKGGTANL